MLNGHEYVACQARKGGIDFTKPDNCFTSVTNGWFTSKTFSNWCTGARLTADFGAVFDRR